MTPFQQHLARKDEQWRVIDAPISNFIGARSVEAYRAVVEQFNVESSPRYMARPEVGKTYCNIFVTDVTRAMFAEIPHWVNGTDPSNHKDDAAHELTVNDVFGLLGDHGLWGWNWCTNADEALGHANVGMPTLAIWYNPFGPGHIAMVVPSDSNQVLVAQAGAFNSHKVPITVAFGSKRLQDVRYFWHE